MWKSRWKMLITPLLSLGVFHILISLSGNNQLNVEFTSPVWYNILTVPGGRLFRRQATILQNLIQEDTAYELAG